ncbi:NodT family efflux transporter outer membrane factor (OMF) lipoprotein [Neolewinella xylanilytica]|uniref:NodT family efflux transporter outer membrane factor (OMF) lipoprotein n=1 Tax=Neolewinella xylanilytica TaxID=1514080 RepID=A0A2S6I9N5_9BACT|nr:efflux transporter outer membrane subunit [Neolewinella xylanilytica]PPK88198.1 NodT family efflux transporter outer membrane factor (OMF) lipoprotein [Neolewinella xylanilytica]
MTNSRNPTYLLLLSIPLFLASCYSAREYVRPEEEIVTARYFRSDSLSQDSASLALVSWKELFTDPYLQDYIEEGLENNIDIRIAIQQIRITETYLQQARLLNRPTVDGTLQYSRSELSKNSQFGAQFSTLNQYQLSGTVAWEADVWDRISSTQRAQRALYLQSVAAHTAVKSRLIANIASTYFDLLSLDEQRRITEQTIVNRQNSLETTRALKEAGNVTEVGVKQTEAQIFTARAILIDINNNIHLLENALSLLLGSDLRDFPRSTLAEQRTTSKLTTGVPAQLLANRPDVIAAEYGLINAFELVNVARADFYPSLTLSATVGLQSLTLGKFLDPSSFFATLVGGAVRPLIDGRRIRTQYAVSELQREQATLDFRSTVLTAAREVSDALYTYAAACEKIEVKEQELAAYDLATEYSEELLVNGYANYLEVLRARENTLNTSLDLVNARNTRLQSVVNLYEALGGGWQ